jgi:hypothetical protein
MILYFTDSLGNKVVIAKDIETPEEAIEKILSNQKSRFVHTAGVRKIKMVGDKRFTFTSADDKPSGYTLED